MQSPNPKVLSLLSNALKAQRSGDLNVASIKYKELLTLQPDNPDANHNLAVILSKTNRIEEASGLFRTALKSSQVIGQFWLSYIDCLIKLNDYQEALTILKEAFSKGFKNSKFHRLRAIVSKELTTGSNFTYQTAQELNTLILHHEDKLAFEGAANLCEIAIKKYPSDYLFLAKFSYLANRLGNVDLEFEILTHLLKYSPNEKVYNNFFSNCWQNSRVLPALTLLESTKKSEIPNYFGRMRDFFLLGIFVAADNVTKRTILENTILQDYQKELIFYFAFKGKTISKRHFLNSIDLLPKVQTTIQCKFKNLIALKHFGRSGTGLFHSLIDNHKSISTLPSYFLSSYFEPQQWRELIDGPFNKLPERFVERYDIMFNPNISDYSVEKHRFMKKFRETEGLNTLGENKDLAFKVNKERFLKYLQGELTNSKYISQSDLFELIHRAYDKSTGEDEHKESIFYHIHNPSDAVLAGYAKAYSGSKFLIMVREPIQALESWIRNDILLNNYIEIVGKISTMIHDFYAPALQQFDTKCIRLEDLKKDPKNVMAKFCNWADLTFQNSLLKMTIGGEKWWGDPTSPNFSTTGSEPFDLTPVQRRPGTVLSVRDRVLISELFAPFSIVFHYKLPKNPSQNSETINAFLLREDMFDFEKRIAENAGLTEHQFRALGTFKYFRIRLKSHMENLEDPNITRNIVKPLVLLS